MNWQFVQILKDSKFQSKRSVLDIDDVKQKTSLFLFYLFTFFLKGKYAWYCFMVFVLLFYVTCVRYRK